MARTRTRKISVTVDAGVLDSVKERLRGSKKSLSAYVSDALAEEVQRERWRELVLEFEREHGAFTAVERKEARAKIAKAMKHRAKGSRAA
jgi:metal-responsive CopG/Arc/MetJ family transcriptional regulator